MNMSSNQLAATNQAGMEALINFAHTQFGVFERLSTLNINAAKIAIEDSANYAKALSVAGDTREFSGLSAALAQPTLDRTIAYSRSVYEVGSHAQGEMARLVEAQAAGFNKNAAMYMDNLAKFAPAGSDVAVSVVKSVLDTVSATYNGLAHFAMQASKRAEDKFAAVNLEVSETSAKDSEDVKDVKDVRDSKDSKKKAV
jgi:phasin family protein